MPSALMSATELEKYIGELEKENKELKEHKENLIRVDKKKSDHIDELEEENEQLRKRIKEHCNTQTLADYKQRFERK